MVSLLVVSADDRTRSQLTEWLGGPDRRVVALADVAEAAAPPANGSIDVAFIDLDRQEVSATSGVERMREARPRVPVVTIAASPTAATLGRLRRAGVYFTMVKPLDRLEVQDVATSALRRAAV